jgi:MFS family permease
VDSRARRYHAPVGNKWVPILILASAQFVMVLDSSVMNVSISQIVDDLDTTIGGVQLAITAYTLVMAAFMLVGAKLGDIWGRDRAFAIGLAVYGTGSFITALSPNLGVLLFGWSLVEGLGAVLVIPAIAALIAANYEGKDRALAYGIVGGIAAAAVAAGPLIGGFVTTYFSWRYVFVGEVVIVVVILFARRLMKPSPRPDHAPQLDIVGAVLSATGLAVIVFAILQSSEWGLIVPRADLVIAGRTIAPLGFSVVPFLILGGLGILVAFGAWEGRLQRAGRDRLLDLALLDIVHLRAGLSTLLVQQLVLLGTFFVLPVYLQVVVGLDAFETGKKLIPMSAAMLIAAFTGPRLAANLSPRLVSQLGLIAVAVGAVVVLATLDVELNDIGFAIGLALFGIGAGLLASQLGNVIMSSAPPAQTNEAGGLQGTAQNLGASLGTAFIGAILLIGLTSGFANSIEDDPNLPVDLRTELAAQARETGLEVVPVADVEAAATAAGLPQDQVAAIAAAYGEAQLSGLRLALGAVALFSILGLWFTRRLPTRLGGDVVETEPAPLAATPA